MSRRAALPLAVALLAAGCTSSTTGAAAPASSSAAPSTDAGGWPRPRAEPDPDRPVVDLDFSLAEDLRTVTGTETVVFTPDLPTDELVFRLVPNGSGAAGNRLEVDDVSGDDVRGGGYEADDAADPGGLYVVELDSELDAGESTELELAFTLTLGRGTFDRFGTDDGVAWWASGAPLLAW